MDASQPRTRANLDVAKQLGDSELAKLFCDTAARETEHAFAHFRLLHPELAIEQHHAKRYGIVLEALNGGGGLGEAAEPVAGKWICKLCSMIDDPAAGDPDWGIAPGTAFEAIRDDWQCPICGARKASFVPYRGPELISA